MLILYSSRGITFHVASCKTLPNNLLSTISQDEVIFYDGRRNSSPHLSGSLYGLCGSTVPEEYRYMVSSGNEATIRFITDGVSTENSGFVVSYTAFIPSIKKKGKYSLRVPTE